MVTTLAPEREPVAPAGLWTPPSASAAQCSCGEQPWPGPAQRRSRCGRTWLGRALVTVGLGMIPWLVVLAVILPSSARAAHWPAAWIGLDTREGLGLLATGVLLLRRDDRCCLTAAVTAALVLTDAWFDVTTATPGAALVMSVAMAACAEIPVSVLCAAVAIRTVPRGG
jgi:hypothetical protein